MNLSQAAPDALGSWSWGVVVLSLLFWSFVLGLLDGWLRWRNLHTMPVKWNYKKGWYPWWLKRQG